MPLSDIDFGKSTVPLTGTDAFFLDTNILVAYMYEKHEKHVPCFMLLSYLVKNEVVLCTSEIVIAELINSLARVLYIDNKVTEHLHANPTETRSVKRLENQYKSTWGNVIKQQPEVLMKYSELAIIKAEPLIKQMLLIECNDSIIEEVLITMTKIPLASADAMILNVATNFGCQFIFSIDGDLGICSNIDIISSTTTNNDYDINEMMSLFDVKDYLIIELGLDDFNVKFPCVI
ncbi:Predicted nucleic acid-binding protein, contains PIN domain [Paenibacillus uliginis N3/975]|uniref:Predicted nucleic acid-binding protein, contains PIN domain n=1 Tax=Paenibacillus uliginis N3/975 TaxID=1313296 RepID=A0A1X7GS49_9BACL|nr:PIN domain-containing protein [Paenibacillus uliginis]SMF73921.1 Predicted nucleic acid-binding protein, contains PIN domain [Paenibacillus uliginis N3/975]